MLCISQKYNFLKDYKCFQIYADFQNLLHKRRWDCGMCPNK